MSYQPEVPQHPLERQPSGRPVHPLEQPPSRPPETPAPPSIRVQVPGSQPLLTYAILGINILVFLADVSLRYLGYGYHGVGPLTLIGAKNNDAILSGQYWRLVTPLFLHGGIVHLGLNSYFFYVVGRPIERAFGQARFLAIYLLSGIAGAIASFAFSRFDSIGASGALFGLIGAWIPLLYRNRRVLANTRQQIRRIVQVIVINLLIGLLPGIDNWAHLGGLLGGLALGWLAAPRYTVRAEGLDSIRLKDESPQSLVWLLIAAVAALLGGIALLVGLLRSGVVLW